MSLEFCQECGIPHPGIKCPRSSDKLDEMKAQKAKLDREAAARKAAGSIEK